MFIDKFVEVVVTSVFDMQRSQVTYSIKEALRMMEQQQASNIMVRAMQTKLHFDCRCANNYMPKAFRNADVMDLPAKIMSGKFLWILTGKL